MQRNPHDSKRGPSSDGIPKPPNPGRDLNTNPPLNFTQSYGTLQSWYSWLNSYVSSTQCDNSEPYMDANQSYPSFSNSMNATGAKCKRKSKHELKLEAELQRLQYEKEMERQRHEEAMRAADRRLKQEQEKIQEIRRLRETRTPILCAPMQFPQLKMPSYEFVPPSAPMEDIILPSGTSSAVVEKLEQEHKDRMRKMKEAQKNYDEQFQTRLSQVQNSMLFPQTAQTHSWLPKKSSVSMSGLQESRDLDHRPPVETPKRVLKCPPVIPEASEQPAIGVIGLAGSGRSCLVGALADGRWPTDLPNPVTTHAGYLVFDLDHPDGGFQRGSVEENRERYNAFFCDAGLTRLTALLVTSDGALREEDFLLLSIAHAHQVPSAIVRTRLDAWIDNLPRDKCYSLTAQSDYVEADKAFVQRSWAAISQNPCPLIFSVSAFAVIDVRQEGPQSKMARYRQDEDALNSFLIECVHRSRDAVPEEHCMEAESCQAKESSAVCDVLLVGTSQADKEEMLEALKLIMEEKEIRTLTCNNVNAICLSNANPARIRVLVVPNTVNDVDLQLVQHWLRQGERFVVALSNSDVMLDNLAKQARLPLASIDKNLYRNRRLEAAKSEFAKLNLDPAHVTCFVVSNFALGKSEESLVYKLDEDHFVAEIHL